MTLTVPAVSGLRESMLERLDLVPFVKVYDGDVPQDDPPLTIPNSGGVVKPYVVLYAGGGTATSDRACQTPSVLGWAPQVSVVAGYPVDCLQAVDRVRAELTGTRLTLDDGTTGILREPEGDRPILKDESVSPPRFLYPLQYRIVATT